MPSRVIRAPQESTLLGAGLRFAAGGVLAVVVVSASAGPAEVASSAASQASAVATKVEGAVKRGVQRAASAAEHGASVAGQAVNRTAQRVRLQCEATNV